MRGITACSGSFFRFNRDVRLSFTANSLNGLSQGFFLVVFNLYIIVLTREIYPATVGICEDTIAYVTSARMWRWRARRWWTPAATG